jgi:hypothetical protein
MHSAFRSTMRPLWPRDQGEHPCSYESIPQTHEAFLLSVDEMKLSPFLQALQMSSLQREEEIPPAYFPSGQAGLLGLQHADSTSFSFTPGV